MLADEGTVIRKFFLHISKDEQRERLQERLDIPTKNWKFEHGDIEERKYWDDYTDAYEETLSPRRPPTTRPGTSCPSDRKWYRNLLIVEHPRRHARVLDLHYPDPDRDLDKIMIERLTRRRPEPSFSCVPSDQLRSVGSDEGAGGAEAGVGPSQRPPAASDVVLRPGRGLRPFGGRLGPVPRRSGRPTRPGPTGSSRGRRLMEMNPP